METILTPNIFIDRDLSDESSLCIYVRDLPSCVNEVEIKFDLLAWEKLSVSNSVSDKKTFIGLKTRKFYNVKAKYTSDGEEVRLPNASFSPFDKSANEEDKDKNLIPSINTRHKIQEKLKIEMDIKVKIFDEGIERI